MFFFALFICPSGWFVGKVHWVHDLPSSRMFLMTGIMMCGYLSWKQSKVPWIPPNFDVHIRFPRVLTPASRMVISKCTSSYLGSPGVKHLFLFCYIWMSMDLASLNLWLEILPSIPWSISSSSICAKMWNAIRILFRWEGTFWGVSGVESGGIIFWKKTMEPCNSHPAKSRWAWSPGWKVKILASGAWLVTVICPKLFGKSLDPWCLQTCKCKCPPRKPLQSRHCDRKDHERRWLRRLLTSLCDGQFCINFWYSLCKPGHEKNPGKHLPNQSPVIPWWSWTLVVGITTFGTSFQTTNHQVVLEPGKRIFHPVLRILSSPFSALESLRIGVVGGVGWGCQQRCYGFLPR